MSTTFYAQYEQYIKQEAARYEAATKVTAAALATTPEKRAQRAEDTKLIVGLYLDDLRASRQDRLAEADRLAKTPWPGKAYYISNAPDDGSTSGLPKVKVKGKRGKKAKSARRAKSGSKTTPTEQQEHLGAIPVDSAPIALSDVEGTEKERIYKAFENLRAKVAGAQHEFYNGVDGVGYKFVLRLVSNHMFDAGECATTEHDITNEVLSDLSKSIDKVRDIYKYLCSAAKKQGGKAFTENIADRKMHEPILVENEGEDGQTYMEDNPAMHGDVRYKKGGKVYFQESPPQFQRVLPPFIQGRDLEICNYKREGYSNAKIAEILSTTEAAIKQRFVWMRKTNEEMKAMGEVN